MKIRILLQKHSINERYIRREIGAPGIQIRGEVGARVVFLETGDWSQVFGSSAWLEHSFKYPQFPVFQYKNIEYILSLCGVRFLYTCLAEVFHVRQTQ